jgi:type IV pilus assembly protein PilM
VGKSRVIGLDIGTTHVRAAELEFGSGGPRGKGQPELVRYGQVALPIGAVRDGEVSEPQTVASALRQLWIESKFSHKDVVIGVGNQRVLVRVLDYLPTSSTVGPNGPVVQGLLVAATKETVLANTRAVELAGLRPVMVDLNAFALARVQARGELSEGVFAFIDIGARMTNLVIVVGGVPRFVRILPSGGQDVTDALANAMNIGPHEAEALKREIGIGFAVPPELLSAKEAVNDVVSGLIEALRNTLVYYAGSHPGAGIQQVVLTGGGSFLPGVGQYLASASRAQVVVGQPLRTIRVSRHSGIERLSDLQSTFAIPLGLAFGVAA